MTRKLLLASALLLQALGAQAQSPRGEAIIYEGREFEGRSFALRNDTANFEYIGFNDRASSIYVVSGVWEFCNDAFYRGSCRTFGPGEYRDLGSQHNRLSSGRIVEAGRPGWGHGGGGWTPPGEDWSESGRGDVQVFDRQNFAGFLANIDRATPNFDPLGYNDKIASIIVRRGVWEFCTDGGYRGTCRTYGPGEYSRLPSGQDDAYSSARPVNPPPARPPAKPPVKPTPAPLPPAARFSIQLFESPDFSGRSTWLNGSANNLELVGFNDRTESIIVERGRWRLCSDANQKGNCREFSPGRYPMLPGDLRNKISSAVPR
jgi:Beta/Gamma crystallin